MKNTNQIVEDRYQILDLLGEGGIGKTYRALDLSDRTEVAIKVVSLRGTSDWKTLELFDREAKILAQLNHRSIPRYLDYFRTEIDGEETFCLVQEIASGRSLTSWVESARIFSEEEVRAIATQILEILAYLQSFTPPIIHRDLKPQNIIRAESGEIYLVDFGAVRDTYHQTITGGSTIVGTYGYMAPEQFRGQAVLATDLYGLGATLLYLRSGQDPADLPVKNMKLDFRERIEFSPDFAAWIEGLLQPIPEDRYANAERALAVLSGKASARLRRPQHAIAQLSQNGEDLKIVVPPIWLATRASQTTFAVAASLLLLAILGWWLMSATVLRGDLWWILLLSGIVGVPWTLRLLWHLFTVVACEREIEIIDRQVICTSRFNNTTITEYMFPIEEIQFINTPRTGLLNRKGGINVMVSPRKFERSELVCDDRISQPILTCPIFSLGQYLDRAEQLWIRNEILEHLEYLRRTKGDRLWL